MIYRILADTAVGIHLSFIVFVVLGGFSVLRWPRLAWLHVPAFMWGVAIEFGGWICPLTYVENHFRMLGSLAGYDTSFVDRYIVPLIYPELLFPGGFPESGFMWIGVFILVLNSLIYWRLWHRRRQPAR